MKFTFSIHGCKRLLRRPPRGGRGLKYNDLYLMPVVLNVAPLAGGVD